MSYLGSPVLEEEIFGGHRRPVLHIDPLRHGSRHCLDDEDGTNAEDGLR